jgi:hypothetical protein
MAQNHPKSLETKSIERPTQNGRRAERGKAPAVSFGQKEAQKRKKPLRSRKKKKNKKMKQKKIRVTHLFPLRLHLSLHFFGLENSFRINCMCWSLTDMSFPLKLGPYDKKSEY